MSRKRASLANVGRVRQLYYEVNSNPFWCTFVFVGQFLINAYGICARGEFFTTTFLLQRNFIYM